MYHFLYRCVYHRHIIELSYAYGVCKTSDNNPRPTGLAGSMSVGQVSRSVYDIIKFCGFRYTTLDQVRSILPALELRPLNWLRLRPLPFDEGSKSNAGKMDQT